MIQFLFFDLSGSTKETIVLRFYATPLLIDTLELLSPN